MRSAKVSMTKATYAKPCQVLTYVKSLTCHPTGDACIAARAEPVRRGCPELPVHKVQRAWQRRVVNRRSSGTTADDALKSQRFHQPRNRAAGDIETFAPELAPHLPDSVDPEVLLPDTSDFGDQPGVPTRPGAGPRGVTTGGEMGVIRPSRRMRAFARRQWTGRSAEPCRSARPHGRRDDHPLSRM